MRRWLSVFMLAGIVAAAGSARGEDLWTVAKSKGDIHRFSTLFTAQDVRRYLGNDDELQNAIDWCKATGVTKVYIEVFRGNYMADRDTLIKARDRFRKEGFIVNGCVTTTNVHKPSTGYKTVDCYTDEGTQKRIEEIFRFAAGLFDIVMIDDFWFTDCECELCQKGKGDQSWADYRCDLMLKVSKERVIEPARQVNRQVKIIIKYPEWYDRFHERGYDVRRESDLFDITWIGTETRDPDNARWGMKPQFGASWLSLWTRDFSRGKFGGGWYDPLGTTENTYVEQGRQTILGLCPESMLFCYGALQGNTGPKNIEKLRQEVAGHLELAAFVKGEEPRGVGTYKPENSAPGKDRWIFNFVGMVGIPMTAATKFPAESPALFLTYHALADKGIEAALGKTLEQKKPVLVTSTLRSALPESARGGLSAPSVRLLELDEQTAKETEYQVIETVRNLPGKSREELDALRKPLLEPLGIELSAPGRVSLHLFGENKAVIENFNDEPVEVRFAMKGANGYEQALVLPMNAEVKLQSTEGRATITLPPRSLVALKKK